MQGEERGTVTLQIELGPELGREVERAAARQRMPVADYVVAALHRVLAAEADDQEDNRAGWTRLSAASFARDWESEEDRMYDEPS